MEPSVTMQNVEKISKSFFYCHAEDETGNIPEIISLTNCTAYKVLDKQTGLSIIFRLKTTLKNNADPFPRLRRLP